MTIGKLAKETGLNISTINYYIYEGLIEPIDRTHSHYRKFDETTIEKLKLIRQLKRDRYSIKEIKQEINKMGGI